MEMEIQVLVDPVIPLSRRVKFVPQFDASQIGLICAGEFFFTLINRADQNGHRFCFTKVARRLSPKFVAEKPNGFWVRMAKQQFQE
jgi:hypothetical protein